MAANLPYQVHETLEQVAGRPDRVASCTRASTIHGQARPWRSTGFVIALIVVGGLIGSESDRHLPARRAARARAALVSVFGFGLSTVLGVWLLWGVLRSGRL